MTRQRSTGGPLDPVEPASCPRQCARYGCDCAGDFRAPRSRAALHDYLWFCLDHVREYNAAWDYYSGMSEDQIERHLRADTIWQRPTWRFGVGPKGWPGPRIDIEDALGTLGGDGARADAPARERAEPNGEVAQALAVLDLTAPVTHAEIKARYHELAKRLHPDANGGDRAAEDRLKTINRAYATLKNCDFIQHQSR